MLSDQTAQYIKSPLLIEAGKKHAIRHGFFTRRGGCSSGIFKSLNAGLNSGDDIDDVTHNRRQICQVLDLSPDRLATPHQTHSNIAFITKAGISKNRPKADSIITNTAGIAIGIVTADCGPVLFADPENHIIGAAHAGWKGALDGILENTIKAMEQLGARRSNIVASLGPCISQENYEVGPEFYNRFMDKDKAYSKYFITSNKPDHYLYSLNQFIIDRLETMNITAQDMAVCTYKQERDYFSYRRATHRSEKGYGRQLSIISLGSR